MSDRNKFKCIKKDPTIEVKQKANQLIDALNAAVNDLKLSRIIGDYQPGYIYGNVKIHKNGNPLRPIISQIPSPTYSLAKTLNKIISPYIPKDYLLKSTNDFIDLIQSNQCQGTIASLDVESLFTNVPIDETIEIILQNSYSHPTIPPPKIPQLILKNLLQLCTKEAPFKCPEGKLYVQVEGVAMGSPLGPTFANFYMGDLEMRVLNNLANKPSIYARYVDDIFLQIDNEDQLKQLKQQFQDNSVLKFTYEMSVRNKLPFLDILVESENNQFHTKVYHKPTDSGKCLNGKSECVDKYKSSVITNYLNRAYKISDSWSSFHNEVMHIKQVLVNNNYSNTIVEQHIKKFLENKLSSSKLRQCPNKIPIYYQSQHHLNYKVEERIIKNIILNNVKCVKENHKLNIIFYYKNLKTHSLVMKNNLTPRPSDLQQSNLVYKFSCPLPHSKAVEYIGFTQTTLSRRLTMHGQNGSIFKHFMSIHNVKPTREQLTHNTIIIAKANDRYKLSIKEALLILNEKPSLNIQFENFGNILKLYNHRNQRSDVAVVKHTDTTPSLSCTDGEPPPSSLSQNSIPLNPNYLMQRETKTHDIALTTDHSETQDFILKSSDNDNWENDTLDLEATLLNFGINYKNLKCVPLANYLWWNFDFPHRKSDPSQDTHITDSMDASESSVSHIPKESYTNGDTYVECGISSPTISQKIKSMTRKARRTQPFLPT